MASLAIAASLARYAQITQLARATGDRRRAAGADRHSYPKPGATHHPAARRHRAGDPASGHWRGSAMEAPRLGPGTARTHPSQPLPTIPRPTEPRLRQFERHQRAVCRRRGTIPGPGVSRCAVTLLRGTGGQPRLRLPVVGWLRLWCHRWRPNDVGPGLPFRRDPTTRSRSNPPSARRHQLDRHGPPAESSLPSPPHLARPCPTAECHDQRPDDHPPEPRCRPGFADGFRRCVPAVYPHPRWRTRRRLVGPELDPIARQWGRGRVAPSRHAACEGSGTRSRTGGCRADAGIGGQTGPASGSSPGTRPRTTSRAACGWPA